MSHDLTNDDIGKHFVITKDYPPYLKKNYSVVLTRIPSDQFNKATVFCNNGTFDIDPDSLVEAHPVKRFMVFDGKNKGGWSDFLGSFDLLEEAEKSMGLFKVGGHKYTIIDGYTGLPIL